MTGATCGQTDFLCFESCANQSVMCFIEDNSVINSKFLWYALQSAKEEILTKKMVERKVESMAIFVGI